ncbi:hypothetical protein BDW42DRAFT_178943 [Aspergillus taichungensis]|uniref:Uncharacterized protein n=1 Tax=Aspergillus taichungensis TaxID=482145 RepID=A0A2J5HHA7_9EURO|nr:hypothetical protein BDW42DRAFT_178943 [Aspergillus taichungensis]
MYEIKTVMGVLSAETVFVRAPIALPWLALGGSPMPLVVTRLELNIVSRTLLIILILSCHTYHIISISIMYDKRNTTRAKFAI